MTAVIKFILFNDPATTKIYTLSLHDALPISSKVDFRTAAHSTGSSPSAARTPKRSTSTMSARSEEHTSELQSQSNLVCRLLLVKKNDNNKLNRTRQARESYTIQTRLNTSLTA